VTEVRRRRISAGDLSRTFKARRVPAHRNSNVNNGLE
jgi:hypothetical protein